jgi:hypothetical protein
MLLRPKSLVASAFIIAIAVLAILFSDACRNRTRPADVESEPEPRGEPDHYSTTIVRTTDDGANEETTITREIRSGDQRREEWTEQGHKRALIWRPDLGKSYLLDLDRRVYVEIAVIAVIAGKQNLHDDSHLQERASAGSTNGFVQMVDRGLDDAASPDREERRTLADSEIAGHSCKVYEHRVTFPDGHTEITRMFRATDLAGLALRAESETEPATVRVITERKDVSLDVELDLFTVPANFKKVDKLY